MPLNSKQIARLLVPMALLLFACQMLSQPASQLPVDSAATEASGKVATMMSTLQTKASQPPATQAGTPPSAASATKDTRTGAATVTPLKVQSKTLTPAPSKAPGGRATLTPPPGTNYFVHKEIPEFVFPADPKRWAASKAEQNPFTFLVHKSILTCAINAVPGRGIGTPEKVERWQLGRLRWKVYLYGSSALVSINAPRGLFLELIGQQNSKCRTDQQAVLKNALLVGEVDGSQAYDPLPTPTKRPALEGFDCPNTPEVHLRLGDQAHIVTDVLWLRSEPRAEADTQIKKYAQGSPVSIDVLDGPVCTPQFVYWKVSVGLIGEGVPDPLVGWMAEGDLKEYYLAPGD